MKHRSSLAAAAFAGAALFSLSASSFASSDVDTTAGGMFMRSLKNCANVAKLSDSYMRQANRGRSPAEISVIMLESYYGNLTVSGNATSSKGSTEPLLQREIIRIMGLHYNVMANLTEEPRGKQIIVHCLLEN
jgi:hypothetical protein